LKREGYTNEHAIDNKFYIGRTKRNFRTRFNEHRRDFATSTGMSTFSEHVLNAGHEMRPMEETMTILYFENDSRRINALEKLEVMKATTSDPMLNIVHNINPFYHIQFRTRQRPTQTQLAMPCNW
jgi:GIY-YIG catalytic domain.